MTDKKQTPDDETIDPAEMTPEMIAELSNNKGDDEDE